MKKIIDFFKNGFQKVCKKKNVNPQPELPDSIEIDGITYYKVKPEDPGEGWTLVTVEYKGTTYYAYIKNPEEYSLIYTSDKEDFIETFWDFWELVTRPPLQWNVLSWRENAGLNPEFTQDNEGSNIIKLPCEIHDLPLTEEETERLEKYHDQRGMNADDPRIRSRVAAIKVNKDNLLSDGKIECYVKYKTGKGTWPAVWFTHYMDPLEPIPGHERYYQYYEMDVSEYYKSISNGRNSVTWHFPKSQYEDGQGQKERSVSYNEPNLQDSWENTWVKYECSWDNESIKVHWNNEKVMEINNVTGQITDKNNTVLKTFTPGDPLYYPVNEQSRKWQLILSMQFGFSNSDALKQYDLNDFPMYMEIKNLKIYKKQERSND